MRDPSVSFSVTGATSASDTSGIVSSRSRPSTTAATASCPSSPACASATRRMSPIGVAGGASKMRPSGRRAWTVSRGAVRRIEDITRIVADYTRRRGRAASRPAGLPPELLVARRHARRAVQPGVRRTADAPRPAGCRRPATLQSAPLHVGSLTGHGSSRMYPSIRFYGLMPTAHPAILDDLSALADITRDRLLLLLEAQELTVTELCSVLQLPQSTVSRHLKALADSGWVTSRAEGTSRLYSMAPDNRQGPARRLWLLVREQVTESRVAGQDHRRLQTVLAARRSRSQEFFSSAVGQWDRLREELFGAHFHLQARLRPAGPGVGGRRPGLRHRRDDRGAGAVCRARDRGRQLGGHAGGRQAPARRPATPWSSGAAISSSCRSPMPSSTRRC